MLAIESIGKYVSERHAAAKEEGKLTAGQVAAQIRKLYTGCEITAAELKSYAAEWHHSGFYKSNSGSTMGRTYFFAADVNLEALYNSIMADRASAAKIATEPTVTLYTFTAGFRRETGRYGKKRWQPIAQFAAKEVKESQAMCRNQISPENYELLKQHEGADLEAYETFNHFKARMLQIIC